MTSFEAYDIIQLQIAMDNTNKKINRKGVFVMCNNNAMRTEYIDPDKFNIYNTSFSIKRMKMDKKRNCFMIVVEDYKIDENGNIIRIN